MSSISVFVRTPEPSPAAGDATDQLHTSLVAKLHERGYEFEPRVGIIRSGEDVDADFEVRVIHIPSGYEGFCRMAVIEFVAGYAGWTAIDW